MISAGADGLSVTIVNCPPDHNKGACAIAWGLIERLRASKRVERIAIVSIFKNTSPEVDFRHLTAHYPALAIKRSPILHRGEPVRFNGFWFPDSEGRLSSSLLYTPYIAGATLGVRSLRFRERLIRREPGARVLTGSDLILDRGGPFFAAFGPPPNPTLLAVSWPFMFARAARLPYAVMGESVGPLGNSWARSLTKSLLEDARLIGVREDLSREALIDAGLPAGQITTMLDNAFWVKPRRSERVEQLLTERALADRGFLAVTCRPWPNTPGYIAELARTVDLLVPSRFERAALVANMYDPRGAPYLDDRAATYSLYDHVSCKDRVSVIVEDLAPDELASIYGSASVVIGTRLHSVILGLVGGAPVVAVSYSGPKTRGVMSLLGLSDYVLDMETFDHRAAAELAEHATGRQAVGEEIQRLRTHGDALLDELLRQVSEERR
jgi:polysaccharide pyruvyl transferase WcaK-like protein